MRALVFSRDDLTNLCRLVVQSLVQSSPLIRDVVPLDEADRIYEALRDRPHELSGTASDWTLRLTPRSKRAAKQLEALTVTGGATVTSIRFDLGGGEWHLMELLPAAVER